MSDPRPHYTLLYRYRGKGAHTWIHRFSSLGDSFRDTCTETAYSWLNTFRFALRWAVILDPQGRVVHDWRRPKE